MKLVVAKIVNMAIAIQAIYLRTSAPRPSVVSSEETLIRVSPVRVRHAEAEQLCNAANGVLEFVIRIERSTCAWAERTRARSTGSELA